MEVLFNNRAPGTLTHRDEDHKGSKCNDKVKWSGFFARTVHACLQCLTKLEPILCATPQKCANMLQNMWMACASQVVKKRNHVLVGTLHDDQIEWVKANLGCGFVEIMKGHS